MNKFVPPSIEQMALATLLTALDFYEEVLDVLENVPTEQAQAMYRDIVEAREIIQVEVLRRRPNGADDDSEES